MDKNVQDRLAEAFAKEHVLNICDYIIDKNEILYINVKGEDINEKHSRKKLPSARKKVKQIWSGRSSRPRK